MEFFNKFNKIKFLTSSFTKYFSTPCSVSSTNARGLKLLSFLPRLYSVPSFTLHSYKLASGRVNSLRSYLAYMKCSLYTLGECLRFYFFCCSKIKVKGLKVCGFHGKIYSFFFCNSSTSTVKSYLNAKATKLHD